jgi:hypothetical protein
MPCESVCFPLYIWGDMRSCLSLDWCRDSACLGTGNNRCANGMKPGHFRELSIRFSSLLPYFGDGEDMHCRPVGTPNLHMPCLCPYACMHDLCNKHVPSTRERGGLYELYYHPCLAYTTAENESAYTQPTAHKTSAGTVHGLAGKGGPPVPGGDADLPCRAARACTPCVGGRGPCSPPRVRKAASPLRPRVKCCKLPRHTPAAGT